MSIVTIHNGDCEFDGNENISGHADEGDVPLYHKAAHALKDPLYNSEQTIGEFARCVAHYVLRHESLADKEVSIVLLSPERMREFNTQFRDKDFVTDVLSFPADSGSFEKTFAAEQGEGRCVFVDSESQSTCEIDEFHSVFQACAESDVAFAQELTRHLGDVLVCLDYIARQARTHGEAFEREFARVIIHGVLHLLGYVHASYDMERDAMLKKQERILQSFVFSMVK